jgi:hypothetical protein
MEPLNKTPVRIKIRGPRKGEWLLIGTKWKNIVTNEFISDAEMQYQLVFNRYIIHVGY